MPMKCSLEEACQGPDTSTWGQSGVCLWMELANQQRQEQRALAAPQADPTNFFMAPVVSYQQKESIA